MRAEQLETPAELSRALHRALGWVWVSDAAVWVQNASLKRYLETPELVPTQHVWAGPVPNYFDALPPQVELATLARRISVSVYEAWVPNAGVRELGSSEAAARARAYITSKLGRNFKWP